MKNNFSTANIISWPLKAVALGLVFVELMIPFAPALYADGEPVVVTPPAVQAGPPVSVSVAPPWQFSSPPTDDEISRALIFSQSLVPAGQTTGTENTALVDMLTTLRNSPEANRETAIQNFLTNNPVSAWRVALLTELGTFYRKTGHFGKAIEVWEDAWNAGKNANGPRIRAVVDLAIGELCQLTSRLGRTDRLRELLAEVENRDITGPATEKIQGAREGLYTMEHFPERAFLCGPLSLNSIQAFIDPDKANNPVLMAAQSTTNGCSLSQIHDLANSIQMDFRIAKRDPGAEILVPAVVHWNAGHYAALIKETNGLYLAKDPTFGQDFWVTAETLDTEASGYFLVKNGDLPSGWTAVDPANATNIWGKGSCNTGDGDETKDCDETAQECKECCDPGMPNYSFHSMLVSLHIKDTPITYGPPRGERVNFTVTYNSREANQPAVFTYSNFGQKWTCNWLSFITDNSTNTSADLMQYAQGGGANRFTMSGSTGTASPYKERSTVTRTGTNTYERTLPDGSKQVYGQSDGRVGTRNIFLTSSVDPHGNTTTFEYDANLRLVRVIDAIGQTNRLYYESTNDIYLITKVEDPFGRSASFQYSRVDTNSPWRLTQITDAIGMSSQFAYGTGDFITSMTTPYGTTTFSNTNATGALRTLEATNPLGQKEKAEYRERVLTVSELPPSAISNSLGNDFREFRNTFYWDHKVMQEAPSDYAKAKIFHWLHLVSSAAGISSGILEWEKKPLESRVWYNYPGQTDGRVTGTNSLPSVIARALDDGSTQVQRFQYNSKGKPTLTVDPLNRTNQFTYAANGIDLIETRHVVGATTELLAAVSYNSQHLPLRATNAAGKVTAFGYNAYGQLTSLTNAKGETVTMSYDANGFLTNVVGSLPNSKVSFTYDSTNHVRTVTDSQGYTITNSYDNLDRLIRVEYPDGTSELTIYDKLDATMVKNRRNQWSRTIYDATRQPIVTADALGRLTYFDWCACGSLGSITDPMGRVTSWVRDIQGRVQSKYYPDLTHVDYAYETKSGRLKSITDARNQTKAFTYNTDNTLRQITYSNAVVATPSVSFTYDTNYVRVLTMTDGIGTTTYSYNPINGSLGAGMLASIDGPLSNDTITYRYDELGRVTNQAINNVGVNVTYDSIGRVTVMTNALGTFTNTYDTNTLMLTSVAYPNGQSMNLSYFGNDHDRRLQTIWNKKGNGTTISKFDYTYDSDGQIQTWQQELGGVSTNVYNFTYDPVDQLLHGSLSNAVTGALIKQFFYQYDAAGNRTAEQIDMASASASFNNLNQMTSRTNGGAIQFKGSLNEGGTVNVAGKAAIMLTSNRFVGYGVATNGTNSVVLSATDYSNNTTNKTYQIVVTNNAVAKTLGYDLNGNLTNEVSATQTNTYEWDAADRMVARTSGTNRSEFTYDGMSRCVRIVEKTNGVVDSDKRFVWCSLQRCEERDSSGATVTKRFFGRGEQINGGNYYFSVDHLRSVREMSDSSGVVRAKYEYDPYGRRTKLTGDLEADFDFTGYYVHLPTGLCLAPLRSYDPDLARWLSQDPIKEIGGLNLYGYVRNNPINLVDPAGLEGLGQDEYTLPPDGWTPPIINSPPISFPFSLGVVASGTAEGGVAFGGGGNCSLGGGFFHDPSRGNSLGGFIGGGAVAGGPGGYSVNSPNSPTGQPSAVYGRTAGAGAGFFVSNAGTAAELGGPFDQWNLNLPLFGFTFAKCDQTWIATGAAGKSWGISWSVYPTTTVWAGGLNLETGIPDVYDPE